VRPGLLVRCAQRSRGVAVPPARAHDRCRPDRVFARKLPGMP